MAGKPLKILAIDDEQLLLWALERAFKGKELLVNTASTTEQALEKIKLNHYDLFLLHFGLKDQNSQTLLKQIDVPHVSPPTRFIEMRFVDAETAADAVSRKLKEQDPGFNIVPDTRTNRVFLMGTIEQIEQATALLKEIDQAGHDL